MTDCSRMRDESMEIDEELRIIDVKLKQLLRDYEQYFLGVRPREPANARAELQKTMIRLSNSQIRNTGERFKFNTLNAQCLTHKRRWDDILRKIENGSYERHVFKANLHERERGHATTPPPGGRRSSDKANSSQDDIFTRYLEAAQACGQKTEGLTREKLQRVIDKQTTAIQQKMGVKDVKFRVEVVNGKVKLKAKARRAA